MRAVTNPYSTLKITSRNTRVLLLNIHDHTMSVLMLCTGKFCYFTDISLFTKLPSLEIVMSQYLKLVDTRVSSMANVIVCLHVEQYT